MVNRAWDKPDCAPRTADGHPAVSGDDYLKAWRTNDDRIDSAQRQAAVDAIEGLLKGMQGQCSIDYVCRCADRERRFAMRAAAISKPMSGIVVSQIEITDWAQRAER
jgi:hypothetical protein